MIMRIEVETEDDEISPCVRRPLKLFVSKECQKIEEDIFFIYRYITGIRNCTREKRRRY